MAIDVSWEGYEMPGFLIFLFVLFSFLHCRGSRMPTLGGEKFTLGFVEGSI